MKLYWRDTPSDDEALDDGNFDDDIAKADETDAEEVHDKEECVFDEEMLLLVGIGKKMGS